MGYKSLLMSQNSHKSLNLFPISRCGVGLYFLCDSLRGNMDLAHPQESQRPLCRARTLNSADSLPSLCVLGGPGSLQASVQQRPTQCHQCNEVGKEASHHPMARAGAREGVLGSTWKVSPKWEHVFYVSLSSYVHKGDEGTQALGNGASRGAGETERRPGFPTAL